MMESLKAFIKKFTALLICLALLSRAPAAFAQEERKDSIIDGEYLQGMLEDYISSKGLKGENMSIGYCYTPTGDTWLYNGRKWFYSASMYKVPLFMVYAQKVYEGELTQDSDINGMKLSDLEQNVLVYSNNAFAHHAMNYLGGSPVQTHESDIKCREQYQQFSDLPREDYDPDFYDYSYFSAEFMTDVMMTLYYNQERFPNVIDCLKQAQPNEYFNRSLGDKYEIAQKYGSFKEFNNTTGIVYTPNPFILTVMTENMGVNDGIIADCAKMFEEYTLSLDEKLEAFEAQRQAEEQAEKEAAEEAEREAQRQAEEKARAEQEKKEQEERLLLEKQQTEERAEKRRSIITISLSAGGAVLILLIILLAIKKRRGRPRPAGAEGSERHGAEKYREAVRQRRDADEKLSGAEKRPSARSAKNKKAGKYVPRH